MSKKESSVFWEEGGVQELGECGEMDREEIGVW